LIIRVDDELRRAVQRAEGTIKPSNKRDADMDAIAAIIPSWLRPLIVDSNIIIIENDEWLDVPYEAKQYINEMRPPRGQ
jgi:hypothetical protein